MNYSQPSNLSAAADQPLRNQKILTLIDSFHAGGKERRLLELLKGLAARKVCCELIVMSKVVTYPELYNLDLKIHFVERKSRLDTTVLPQLYRIIKEAQPAIIQSWSSMTSVYVFAIAKWLGTPFVNAIIADAPHRVKPFSQPWLRRKLTFPFSNAIISNSAAGVAAYHAPPKKSHVMYNGFDFNRIKNIAPPEALRRQLGIQTPKVVGMVGKFQVRKDYHTYLKAALRVVAERTDVTFLAVGDGELLAACQEVVKGQDHQRIIFTGRREDVESVVSLFDIGVLTTNHRVHGEGISNALMEYMVLGKPVIATEGGGTAELVLDGEVGYVIPPADVNALVEKLQLLLNNGELVQRLGSAGEARIREHFNLDRMAEEYIALYQQLLN